MNHKKRLFKNLGLFLLPMGVFIGVLFCMPLDKQYAYHFIKNDCNDKGAWIYDRLFTNPRTVDMALVGSSRTKAFADEAVIEGGLEQQAQNISVANLGYCRWGRNMDFAIIKELLAHKHTKYIVIELHEEEERLGHIDFGYVADSRDLLLPVPFFNQHFFSDIYKGLTIRFEILKHKLLYSPKAFPVKIEDHWYVSSNQVASAEDLDNAKRKKENYQYNSGPLEQRINNIYPFRYLDKIATLAREHGCKLFFLYLPGYGALPQPQGYFDYCKPYGPVFQAPRSILDNKANWMDDAHLNDSGAKQLSSWLVSQMAPYVGK